MIKIERPIARRKAQTGEQSSPHHVYIETFGCQMNEYDTELIRSLLKNRGFAFTDDGERADIVLMNTCAIRENAHNRVHGHLAELTERKRRAGLVIGVLGCMAQNLKKELLDTHPLIDVLVGPDGYRRLPDLLIEAIAHQTQGLAVDLSEYETYDTIIPDRRPGVAGWIAIMRGCDNFCTFCVVPYTRGRERSRNPQGILEEAQELARQGCKQVTLLGQNVNSYSFADWDFAKVLTAVADVSGIERVRFMSPHPKDFPPPLLEAVAGHPRICKHIHLPVQSGSDRILEMMGRGYTRREYLRLVEQIRKLGRIVLSTDVICGFCTESDQEFEETARLLQELSYQSAFVFKYSERKNTIAFRKYPDDVPDTVKSERVTRLVNMQRQISLSHNRRAIGDTVTVLVEGDAKKSQDQWMGHTDGNVTVVCEKSLLSASPGDFVRVRIQDASASTLYAVPVDS